MSRVLAVLLLVLSSACAQASEWTGELLLESARLAAGGDLWRGIVALRGHGRLAVGGLSGSIESLEHVRDGRSASSYRLGPIEGAQGYDGDVAWSRSGGEVIVPDSDEELAAARTRAWLTRRGYFDAEGAHYGEAQVRRDDGVEYLVLEAVPDGGAPVELWFDARTHLLARSTQQTGQDRQVTRYEDYRDVAGLQLPFRVVTEGDDDRNRAMVGYETLQVANDVADDALARPDAASDDFGFTDGAAAAVVPFDLLNNHIYVDAEIDGVSVRLLVDTGGVNLLTPQAVARLGLDQEGRMAARGVGEERVDLAFARGRTLQIGTLRFDAPLFHVIDLGDLPAVEGFVFDGLIGYEVFHRLVVSIDYAGRTLTLIHPDHYRPPADAIQVPFALSGRIPVVDGEIDGRTAKLSIDTGSRSSLSLHTPFVREHDLVEHYAASFETVDGWGVGGPSRSWPVRVGRVRVGNAEVSDVVADLAAAEHGAFANPGISANVGSGLLRRFVVDFDYRERRLCLVPGADHDLRDHYDRAGMWLMLDDGALRVAALVQDGPAERAGMRVDDRIVALDGEPVTARSLTDWRGFFRETDAGIEVRVRYRRADAVSSTVLELTDLIAPPQ